MKTFKGYLTEMKPHHSQYNYDTNELIFDISGLNDAGQYRNLPLVLSTTALERACGRLTKIKG